MSSTPRFRLLHWLAISLLLFVVANVVAAHWPSSPLAVTLYKAHMVSLAGWMGYWLDRALFPYSRPHQCFGGVCTTSRDEQAGLYMLRRAIIVAACLIAVSLGA